MAAPRCVVCGRNKVIARGFCDAHYRRWRLGQSLEAPLVLDDWTDDELRQLMTSYAAPRPNLESLAKRLGRHKTNICRKARELGLTDKKRGKRPVQFKLNYILPIGSPEHLARASLRMKKWHKENEHPRGMAGKKHTKETLDVLSVKSRERWGDPGSKLNSDGNKQRMSDQMLARNIAGIMQGKGSYSRVRGGRRADLDNKYFRSRWEANYARYLNWLVAKKEIAGWEFEPKTFYFEAIKRGTRSYTPDFRIQNNDGSFEWHEVKGWMDQKSQTKLNRMAKYYPDEKIVLKREDFFRSIKKSGLNRLIGGWE